MLDAMSRRVLLPNATGAVLVIATISLGLSVLAEAKLTFLGVAMPESKPLPDTLIRVGNEYLLSGVWWVVILPSVVLAILVLAVNFLGDWLRDARDPKLRRAVAQLEISDLRVAFPTRRGTLVAVDGTSLAIDEGEMPGVAAGVRPRERCRAATGVSSPATASRSRALVPPWARAHRGRALIGSSKLHGDRMSALFIDKGTVITMDAERRVLDPGAVLVRDGRIEAVGDSEALEPLAGDAARIDARRMVVMPGLIDSHGHAGHALVKSLGAGDTDAWVEACLQIYASGSSADFWRAEARLASLDRLKAGVTTSVSLLGGGTDLIRNDSPEYALAYADAVGECGTRAYLAMGPNRPPYPHRFVHRESGTERVVDLDQQLAVVRETLLAGRGLHEDRVRFCLGAPVFGPGRTAEGLDDKALRALHERLMTLREELAVLYTQDGHRAGTLAFAREMGALGPWSLMSHAVDLTDEDIEAARDSGAVIVHNPSAIMSIRGRCPVPELIDEGVTVVLGSDAAAPDRGYDMFRHMAQCMHYHRRHFRDSRIMPAGKVLEMATIDAAHGLGRGDELGSLEPGKRADLILVDLFKPHLVPINMAPMRLAHFANAADVDTVIVDGAVVMRGREALRVDERAVLEDAGLQMERVIADNELSALLELPSGFWGASGLPAGAVQ